MLWDKALTVANDAREAQVLLPIATMSSVVSEQGIDFFIKIMNDNLTKKMQQGQTGKNPFLPYDEQMFVDTVGHEHVCLLNKYPAGEPHLLIVVKRLLINHLYLTFMIFLHGFKVLLILMCLDSLTQHQRRVRVNVIGICS